MPDSNIALAVERSIAGQSDLMTSLGLAVIGGLLAILLRIRIHNATHQGQLLALRWNAACYLSLSFAGLTILFGYLLSGMFVQAAPQLFSHQFDVTRKFSDQAFEHAPVSQLLLLSQLQFGFFVAAVAAGVVFMLGNRK